MADQRRRRRGRRGPLTALVAIALTILAAFGAFELTRGGPTTVSLRTLVYEQAAYVGHEVTTRGLVRRFTDPDGTSYYVLTDPEQDQVILQPAAVARRYAGREVRVTDRLRFDPQAGRVLRARRIGPS